MNIIYWKFEIFAPNLTFLVITRKFLKMLSRDFSILVLVQSAVLNQRQYVLSHHKHLLIFILLVLIQELCYRKTAYCSYSGCLKGG